MAEDHRIFHAEAALLPPRRRPPDGEEIMEIDFRDKELTFEEVYPKAPYSELIRLVLALTDMLFRLKARVRFRRSPTSIDRNPAGAA